MGSCRCLPKILQFLSSATGFLVFLTVFGCENPRIRTQIVHLPMREEFKDTIFVKKILWPKFSKNDKTNPILFSCFFAFDNSAGPLKESGPGYSVPPCPPLTVLMRYSHKYQSRTLLQCEGYLNTTYR